MIDIKGLLFVPMACCLLLPVEFLTYNWFTFGCKAVLAALKSLIHPPDSEESGLRTTRAVLGSIRLKSYIRLPSW